MREIIESGAIVDVMLLFVAIEVALLLLIRRRSGAGIAPRALLLNVGAGVSLMLALRTALVGAGWTWIAACLVGALVFHVADLAERWRPAPGASA